MKNKYYPSDLSLTDSCYDTIYDNHKDTDISGIWCNHLKK